MPRFTDRDASHSPAEARGRVFWAAALAAGLAGGLVAWGAGEASLVPETGMGSHGGARFVSNESYALRNGVRSYALTGGALGLALGLAGGLTRGSAAGAAVAGLAGLAAGAAATAAAARGLIPVYYATVRFNVVAYAMAVHAGVFAAAGAAGGLALGGGLGGARKAAAGLVGGAIGGLVAAVLYDAVGIIAFPLDQTDRPLSISPSTRLMARVVLGLLAAAGAAYATRPGRREGAVRV